MVVQVRWEVTAVGRLVGRLRDLSGRLGRWDLCKSVPEAAQKYLFSMEWPRLVPKKKIRNAKFILAKYPSAGSGSVSGF